MWLITNEYIRGFFVLFLFLHSMYQATNFRRFLWHSGVSSVKSIQSVDRTVYKLLVNMTRFLIFFWKFFIFCYFPGTRIITGNALGWSSLMHALNQNKACIRSKIFPFVSDTNSFAVPDITKVTRIVHPSVTKVTRVIEGVPSVTTVRRVIEGDPSITKITKVIEGEPSFTKVTRVIEADPSVTKVTRVVEGKIPAHHPILNSWMVQKKNLGLHFFVKLCVSVFTCQTKLK